MSLKVSYLGLELNNPVIVASSPFTMSLDRIQRLEEHGPGAIVLKSVFEEQILGEASFLERYNNYPEAADYLNNYVGQEYINGHLKLISDARKHTKLPIIASINCRSTGAWVDYAYSMEKAGADAIELNIFFLPTDSAEIASEIEQRYLDIVSQVTQRVSIPVSVKLGMRFTNILNVCREIYYRGSRGVVMFNRFFEPDIDIDNVQMVSADSLSQPTELRNNLRTVGMCVSELPVLDVAVTTGVHTGADVVKSILVGAKAVQVCSALYHDGLGAIDSMKKFLEEWMNRRGFESLEKFRGLLSYKDNADKELYQRVQYMKFMPKERA